MVCSKPEKVTSSSCGSVVNSGTVVVGTCVVTSSNSVVNLGRVVGFLLLGVLTLLFCTLFLKPFLRPLGVVN